MSTGTPHGGTAPVREADSGGDHADKPEREPSSDTAGAAKRSDSPRGAVRAGRPGPRWRFQSLHRRRSRLAKLPPWWGTVARVATIASAQTAGFSEIAALAIDAREGDLWVMSTEPRMAAAIHKLQLISGRVFYTVALPDNLAPARFADVAVTSRSMILILDAVGRRLFKLEPKSRDLQLAAKIDVDGATSAAPESDGIVYVAHQKGISRVDLGSRRTTALKVKRNLDLAGVTRIRWHRGALLGVQKSGSGVYQIVRIKLDSAVVPPPSASTCSTAMWQWPIPRPPRSRATFSTTWRAPAPPIERRRDDHPAGYREVGTSRMVNGKG